jgi:hypothetical protein
MDEYKECWHCGMIPVVGKCKFITPFMPTWLDLCVNCCKQIIIYGYLVTYISYAVELDEAGQLAVIMAA